MKASQPTHPIRVAKRRAPKKPLFAASKIETLEGRIAPATLYVDNFSDLASHITTDNGAPGLDAGDIVTWDPGAASHHGGAVTGLTFGVNVFATITDALGAAAVGGDTIRVGPGLFTESFNVTKQVTLLGNETGNDAATRDGVVSLADETILHGALSGSLHTTQVTISTSDVTLDGFLVEGQTSANVFGAAVYEAPGTHGTHVSNNIIQDNITGVYVSNNSPSDQNVLSHNLFRNNTQPGPGSGQDIYADQFTAGTLEHLLITDNKFTNTAYVEDSWAIGFSNTGGAAFQDLVIQNNTVDGHGRGMYFYNASDVTISGNDIGGAGRYAVGIFGLNGTPANANFTITGNTIHDSFRGVYISDDSTAPAITSVPSVGGNTFTNVTNPYDLEILGGQILGPTDFGSADVTIVGDVIDFVGGPGSITGTGKITIVPLTADASIGLNGGAGTLQIDHTDLLALGSGFSGIVFGTAGQAHDITLDTDSAFTFGVALTLNANGVGGSVHILDSNLGNGRTALHANAGLTIHGSGATTTLNTDVVTAGTPILINDSVVVAADVTLDSTNAGAAAAGANVTITGFIESDVADHFSLTITAGTAGDAIFGDGAGVADANIGATEKLGALAITAHGITWNADVASISTLGGSHTGNITLTATTISAVPGISAAGGGALSLTTTGSDLTQTGAWAVTGATTLNVGATHDITLTNVGNDFNSVSVTTGHNVLLTEANALVLAASTISGTLGVVTSGGITQTGALVVTGVTTLAAGSANNITLTNPGNNFSTLGITSGHDVTVTDANAIVLAASTVSGLLAVTTAGTITQTGVLSVGAATFSAGAANDITLNNASNDFSSVGITSGRNVLLTDANALALAASTVSGTFGVTTNGDLTQSGPLSITGTSSFSTGAHAVNLSDPANDFIGAVSVTNSGANAVSVRDVNALLLGTFNVGSGALNLNAGNGLTQTGIITQAAGAGAATLSGNNGSIVLGLANDFTGAVVASTTGAGASITIADNAGGLNASTISTLDGAITLSANNGSLTATNVFAGGTANISLTTTGAGSNVLAGTIDATGDTITINSAGNITDNNAVNNNFAAQNLSLTAATGIGAADALESTVTNFTASNVTGNIQLKNTGALTINGANVTGASGNITIDAASPITIAANESAPGAISHTAGETNDNPAFADDLTVNTGISITSTGASVTLQAGDDISIGAGATISATTTATLTAAFGDLDGEGGILHGGSITATNDVTISAHDNVALGGNVTSTAGNVSITSTAADLTHTAGTIAGNLVTLIAGGADGDIGALGAAIVTAALTVSFTGSGTGEVAITESNGATVSGTTGSGDINLTSTTGDWTIGGNITTTGNVNLTASAGDLVRTGGTVSGNAVTLVAGGADGDIGAAATPILTSATTLSFTGTGTGEVAVTESNGATVSGTTGSGAINLISTTGDWTIGGNITTTGSVNVTATAGDLLESTGTIGGNAVTLVAGGADGDIGVAGTPILTAATTLSFTGAGTGEVAITESNGATVSGTTGSGAINLTSTTGDWTIGNNITTTGNVNLTASAGDILRTAGTVSGNGVTLVAGGADGDIGVVGTPILTAATTLSFTGAGTGEVAITESNGATVSGTTGSGAINLISTTGNWTVGGNITTTGNVNVTAIAGDILESTGTIGGNTVTLVAGGADGDIGVAGTPILTAATTLSFTGAGTGEISITESNGATVSGTTGSGVINLTSTTGDWTIGNNITTTGNVTMAASAGDILRTTGTVSGNALSFTAGGADGDIGAAGAVIQTNGTSIAFTGTGTGDVHITEANGALVSGSTGSGVINLTSTTGDWTVQNTGLSTTGNVTLSAVAGDLLRVGAGAVVAGNVVALNAGGADGGIGAAGTPFLTSATTLSFVATGTGNVNLSETDSVTLSGVAGAGNTSVQVNAGGTINLDLLALSAASSVANIVATGAVLDNNAAANNIAALAAVISAGSGIGTAANPLETNIANLEAVGGAGGGVFINEANALTIGGIGAMNGVSATGDDILILSGALSITEQINTPNDVTLTATGAITESGAGFINADTLTAASAGGQTLGGVNTIGHFTATNTGAGTGITLQNTKNNFEILTVTNQIGGNVIINNDGIDADVNGIVKSGNPALGGDIIISTDGELTVNATVDSSGGSGGTLTLGGLLTVNASPIVGAGDVTLQGGAGPLTINAPISVASPLVLQSTEDINILAKVETTSLLSDLTVLADSDGDGDGGVFIGDNVLVGSLKAGHNLDVRGSEYLGSFSVVDGNQDNGVVIKSNGTDPRLEATDNVFVKINDAAPPTSQIWLGGLVRSNGSGNVEFASAVNVIDDDARVVSHGTGNIIFDGTIDSDVTGPFEMRVATGTGTALFKGAVGQVEPMGDVTVEVAGDVGIEAPFTAASFSVGNASGLVDISGDLTTTNDGLNLTINAVAISINAPVDMTGATAGNGLLQTDSLDILADISGNGVFTIQPRTTNLTIGLNAAGDLNLDSDEIGHLQDGFGQIVIGRADGSGLLTVGERVAPDAWLDPVVFRSPAGGGKIALEGQLNATDDGGFTFLAPSMTVNTPGVPSISTAGGDVHFGSLTANIAVTLLSDFAIETNGGDVLQVGTINGAFALSIDADTGGVNINGSLTPVPGGTSIGGTAALDSISIIGGAVQLRPNVQTTGGQDYTGTTLQIFSGAYTSLLGGDISFTGAATLSNSLTVLSHGGDINFNGTVDNVADPLTPAGKGALVLNADTGEIHFTGAVGGVEELKTVDINGAAGLTVADTFSVAGSFKVKSDEIDFGGGDDSVTIGGAVELHPYSANVQIEIGGAESATPNSLSLSSDDIGALTDGATSLTISALAPGQPVTVIGAVTFHDPTTILTNAKTGGIVTINDAITADTADGGITLRAPSVFLAANISATGGGSIDISNAVLQGDTILDTSAGGGNVTLRDKFTAIPGGADLTIDAGTGDINILTRLGLASAALGDVALHSGGDTLIKVGGYMDSLLIDGGGTTFLAGRIQTNGAGGQDYANAVILTGSATLVSTHATGAVHFHDTVDSDTKARNLGITNHAAVAGTEVVTFDADLGLAQPANASRLGTINTQTRGDAVFGGDVNAVSFSLKAGTLALQDVTVQKNLIVQGDGTFNGALTADKLSIRSTGDIDNLGIAWTATTSAILYSLTGDVTATGANAFGMLQLTADNATVEESGTMNLGAVRVKSTLDVTTTGGGDLTQLATQRVVAGKLEGDISGSISLGHVRNTFTQIGDDSVGLSAGGPIEIWSAMPKATILEGNITTASGDITLVANPLGHLGYFQLGSSLSLAPAGRWVIFSNFALVPSMNVDLINDLSPDTVISHQAHPFPGLPASGNVLVYVSLAGR